MIFLKLGIIIVGAILLGYTISSLWLWFLVPLFKVPTITVAHAIGLRLLFVALTVPDLFTKDDESVNITPILFPLFTHAIGWLLNYYFMMP